MADALTTVFDAARKWADELTTYIEPDAVKRGADEDAEGYESEADQISAALEELQPITVYFTGDEEGPDRFGIVYDTEDEALECAFENDLVIWRVPVIPNWDGSERVGPDVDEEAGNA
jgi:hypothetical protein